MKAPELPRSVLGQLPTPCLLVDLPAVDRNIERAASHFRDAKVKLRPHFKAHKCTTLMHRQIAAGGCVGVTCQTAAEALVLARAGFGDILVANQIVDPFALVELADAARLSTVTVAVDDIRHVELLTELAGTSSLSLGAVIELDVGIGRCGVPLGSDRLVPLAEAITRSAGLAFRGVQAYEGHVVMREDRSLRRTMLSQIYAGVQDELRRLEQSGFECEIVSGAGTGTFDLAANGGLVTEVQAGSYVLMDAKYATLDLPFEPALYIATRVISRRDPEAGVLNAGLKETSVEYGTPKPVGHEIGIIALSDEHARIAVHSGDKPGVGEVVFLVPAHIDPTINMHDALFVWDGAGGLERWPVDGRRDTGAFGAAVPMHGIGLGTEVPA
jgi:D-serine deaminase-like pyridoxal phosphate-dependent protein